MKPEEMEPIPEETVQLARVVCPHDNLCLLLSDELGEVFQEVLFASLFPRRGQPAESPWRLAMVTVLQFAEGLSDRQAANAVRTRIDWKYALHLHLNDVGFHFSILSEFRARLIGAGAERDLFDALLRHATTRGWLKMRGRQRTASRHVLAAIQSLSRLNVSVRPCVTRSISLQRWLPNGSRSAFQRNGTSDMPRGGKITDFPLVVKNEKNSRL